MSNPQRFRKKPVEIEAMQWHADRGAHAAIEPVQWVEANGGEYRIDPANGGLYIVTLEGEMRVQDGDWIIRGVQGEFYPCKPDIFEQTYERALSPIPVTQEAVPSAVQTKRALHDAIQAHAGVEWGGDLVVDWVLVAGLAGVQVEHSIGIEESRDNTPAYITNGLLYEALHLGAEYDLADDGD